MTVLTYLIILLALLGVYLIVMSRYADHLTAGRQIWHLVCFLFGALAALAIFIPSPDLFGPDFRFSVSMGQFLLAVDLGPLLLFLGFPVGILRLPARWDKLGRFLSRPLLTGMISSIILVSWHTPVLFEAASRDYSTWILKEGLLLVSGLILWLPVAGPFPGWKAAYPIQLIYLFTLRIPMAILGSIFTFANGLIYAPRSFALEICAPSSVPDQQLGGLLMSVIGGLIGFTALTVVFFTWTGKTNPSDSN